MAAKITEKEYLLARMRVSRCRCGESASAVYGFDKTSEIAVPYKADEATIKGWDHQVSVAFTLEDVMDKLNQIQSRKLTAHPDPEIVKRMDKLEKGLAKVFRQLESLKDSRHTSKDVADSVIRGLQDALGSGV
jgi:hypothetical protein